MNTTQVKKLTGFSVAALLVGGTIAVASPANAMTFNFSGTVTEVYGNSIPTGINVGDPFTGLVTYSPPNSPNVSYDGSSYADITPSSKVEVTIEGFTFKSLPYPSTSGLAPIIRYTLDDVTEPSSILSFLTVGIGEASNLLNPETASLYGGSRISYSGIWGYLPDSSISIASADFGLGSDFVINGNIDVAIFQPVPEPSSVLGTMVFAGVGAAVLMKRRKKQLSA